MADREFTVSGGDINVARKVLHDYIDTLETVTVDRTSGMVELIGGRHHIGIPNADLAEALLAPEPALVEAPEPPAGTDTSATTETASESPKPSKPSR